MFLELDPSNPNYRPIYKAERLCFWLRLLALFTTSIPIEDRGPFIERMEEICEEIRRLGKTYWPELPWLESLISEIEEEVCSLERRVERDVSLDNVSLQCRRCGRELENYPLPWPTDAEFLTVDDTALAPSQSCRCKWCLAKFYKLFDQMIGSEGLDLVEL